MRLDEVGPPFGDDSNGGWYPDPLGGKQLRFWDGASWTARIRSAEKASAVGPSKAGLQEADRWPSAKGLSFKEGFRWGKLKRLRERLLSLRNRPIEPLEPYAKELATLTEAVGGTVAPSPMLEGVHASYMALVGSEVVEKKQVEKLIDGLVQVVEQELDQLQMLTDAAKVAPPAQVPPSTPSPDGAVPATGRGITAAGGAEVAPQTEATRQSDPPDEKVCPDCAETVKGAARVCRYCGFRFDEAAEAAELRQLTGRDSPARISDETMQRLRHYAALRDGGGLDDRELELLRDWRLSPSFTDRIADTKAGGFRPFTHRVGGTGDGLAALSLSGGFEGFEDWLKVQDANRGIRKERLGIAGQLGKLGEPPRIAANGVLAGDLSEGTLVLTDQRLLFARQKMGILGPLSEVVRLESFRIDQIEWVKGTARGRKGFLRFKTKSNVWDFRNVTPRGRAEEIEAFVRGRQAAQSSLAGAGATKLAHLKDLESRGELEAAEVAVLERSLAG